MSSILFLMGRLLVSELNTVQTPPALGFSSHLSITCQNVVFSHDTIMCPLDLYVLLSEVKSSKHFKEA